MLMTNANKLGLWVRDNFPEPLTHLRVQKLSFYCYGAALAFNLDIGDDIVFEPWDNGPVCVDLWKEYRHYGVAPITLPIYDAPKYSPQTEDLMRDVLSIYGRLPSWNLRNQSCLEKPWIDASLKKQPISTTDLRVHFANKFRDEVKCPEYLVSAGSFSLDNIPLATYPSLKSLAISLKQAFLK